jgi:hypothetical protein
MGVQKILMLTAKYKYLGLTCLKLKLHSDERILGFGSRSNFK